MNKKRFTLDDEENGLCRCILVDGEEMPTCEICDLLNKQQATITHLEKANGKNFAKRRLLERDNLVLRNENEQLRQKLKKYEDKEFERTQMRGW